MTHDTAKTIADLSLHLGTIFAKPLDFEVLPESEHYGFEGEPVTAVMVNDMVTIYPHEVKTSTFTGANDGWTLGTQTRWAIDVLMDASDPSVGIYGCEPQNVNEGLDFVAAAIRIGQIIVEQAVFSSATAQAESEIAEEDRRSTEAHLAAWEEFHKNEGV